MPKPEHSPTPFDGSQREIPHEEQLLAGRIFQRGIKGLFDRHSDDVVDIVDPFSRRQRLPLFLPGIRGDSSIMLMQTLYLFSGTISNYALQISPYTPRTSVDAHNGTVYNYHLEDGIVKRMDTHQSEKYIGDQAALSESELEHFAEEAELNLELETSMGFWDQPVGIKEVSNILDLARQAELEPVTWGELVWDHARRGDPEETMYKEDLTHASTVFTNRITKLMGQGKSSIVIASEGDEVEEKIETGDPSSVLVTVGKITYLRTGAKRYIANITRQNQADVTAIDYTRIGDRVISTVSVRGDIVVLPTFVDTTGVQRLARFFRKPNTKI